MAKDYDRYSQFEDRISSKCADKTNVRGYSYPAGREVDLQVDYLYSDGKHINFRERVVCPITGLNNRLRACLHLLDVELGIYDGDNIYITEQVTPMYQILSNFYPNLIGSEYLDDNVPLGASNQSGIRNEDLTRLTFSDASFDVVMSFDCFEHIHQYRTAFAEISRVLRDGGRLFWTVPFVRNSATNIVRARIDTNGMIEHLLEPEYHGDPLNPEGKCLCFTHFGWQMLKEVEEAGFEDAYAVLVWSDIFGYLGGEQIFFFASK
jgi:SAM-dependent methyltransferase